MLKSKLLLLTLGGLFCVGASAGPILGTFNINGGPGGQVGVGLTTIDWYPAGGTTGALVVVSGGTGIFSGLGGGVLDVGTIHDLDSTLQLVGAPGFTLADFLVINSLPLWDWTATFIEPGVYSSAECGLEAAPGQVCTPFASSPFNLANTTSGSTAGFSLTGTATDGVGGLYNFRAEFATPFVSQPYQDILAALPYQSAWAGSVSVEQVPEPATFFLISAGLIGVGLIRRVLR